MAGTVDDRHVPGSETFGIAGGGDETFPSNSVDSVLAIGKAWIGKRIEGVIG